MCYFLYKNPNTKLDSRGIFIFIRYKPFYFYRHNSMPVPIKYL